MSCYPLLQRSRSSLAHQLPVLPPVESFISDLEDALRWWIEDEPQHQMVAISAKVGETTLPREQFSAPHASFKDKNVFLNQIRFAARNRVCVNITYNGIPRRIEPYSLRNPKTGNLLLYVFELTRGAESGQGIKALNVNEIQNVEITAIAFVARYTVEL